MSVIEATFWEQVLNSSAIHILLFLRAAIGLLLGFCLTRFVHWTGACISIIAFIVGWHVIAETQLLANSIQSTQDVI